MNIPIRIKQYKQKSSNSRFSVLQGLKTLWHNLKMLFTQRLLAGGGGWRINTETSFVVDDFSIVWKDGKPEFVKTPEGDVNAVLEISQKID